MTERIRHTAFDMHHPAVPATYLLITLCLTMFSMQPVLIGISLVAALVFGCLERGARDTLRSLRWQLPLIALIAIANPLFSASGSTELMRIGLRAVYLESVWYGCAMGALFVASMLWFCAAASLLPFDKVMALFGNAAPTLALMVSMCMRLIPKFIRQGRLVSAVQGAMEPGTFGARAAADAVRLRLRLSTVLMGWGMEDSLQTADAMRARGWGAAGRRSTYTRYRFTATDAAALVALALAGSFVAALAVAATAQFSFYPTTSRLVVWWGYLPYALWMFVPTALHLREARRLR